MFRDHVTERYQITSAVKDWKGAHWVKPTYQEWVKEMTNEDWVVFDALNKVHMLPDVYHQSYVKTFTPEEVKKIDTSEGTPPPLKWLENPDADIYECDGLKPEQGNSSSDYGVRFLRRHHKDVIPALKEGKPLTMPILQRTENGKFIAQAGRHRIVYCVTLGLSLQAFVTNWEDIMAANPKGLK